MIPGGETVGVIRPTTETDRYGDASVVYGVAVTHRIRHAAFNPGGSTEVVDGRTAVVTRPTLYLPAGADVTASDRLVVRGRVFEATGTPAVWTSPYDGTTSGVVVELTEVTG